MYPVRVRAFSATVPFRGRAVRWKNQMWNIVSNWWVAFVLVLEQKGTWAILRAQISLEVTFMSANWVRRGSSACLGALEAFQNRFQRLLRTPKITSEGSQHAFEEKMCSEWSLGRVWDTFGTPSGRPFGKKKRTRNDSEQVFIYNQVETSFSKGLEQILKWFMAWFYRVCRCDRPHENNDTATLRIFKNICVFTVILHIHVVEEAIQKTKKYMFYGFRWCNPSEGVSGPP